MDEESDNIDESKQEQPPAPVETTTVAKNISASRKPMIPAGGAVSETLRRLDGVVNPFQVSLQTIVDILSEQTKEIHALRTDVTAVTQRVEIVIAEAQGNQKGLKDFQDTIEVILAKFRKDVAKTQDEVAEVRESNVATLAAVDELSGRIADFPEIKAESIRQKAQVEDINGKMEMLGAEMAFFLKSSTDQFSALEDRSTEFETGLKALRVHVDGLADALVLSANQITVAASAGFGGKPMNLFEVLKLCNSSIMALNTTTSEHTNQIADNVKATDKKADESVLVEINNHENKIKEIEDKLRKDEEEGVNALRKSCRALADMVEHLQFDLEEKVDVRSVDAIVHKKYEEIVHYLKDALSATQEDEQNFKEKVEEFQRTVQKLSVTKVDRTEVAPMQEFIVTAEATLKKLTKDQSNPKDVFTKEELLPILESKVNKHDYEEGYDSLMKVLKKTRKLAALSGNYGEPSDDSNQNLEALKKKPLMSATSMGLLSKANDKPRGSGAAVGRAMTANASSTTSNNNMFAAYAMREKQVRMQLQGATIVSLPPAGHDMGMGHPFPDGGMYGDDSGDDRVYPHGDRPRTTGVGARGALKGSSRPGTSSGGAMAPGSSSMHERSTSATSTGASTRYNSPPRLNGEGDIAHVGSATVGAGFNLRSTSPLPKEPLAALGGHATDLTDPDLDITETRIQGKDGKLYYGQQAEVPTN